MTARTTPASNPMDANLMHIAAANHRALTAMARLTARSAQGMLAAHQHVAGFVARRLQRDLDAARRLGKCKDAPEAMAVTQSLCMQAIADYAEEATALMRVGANAIATGTAEDPAHH
ncbi:MAG: hypothetical protein EA355_11675 [Rhodobacteraceae bacterium]|nr:MAG: hypothetical protein EA355_11675 [Paracoccaceae bacterium]